MSIADLDPVIHAPKRLGVMALLAGADRADFGFVKDHLDISDDDRDFIGRETLEDHKLFGGGWYQVGLALEGRGVRPEHSR